MTDEQFHELMTRVLAEEASAEEVSGLEALLQKDAGRRQEFADFKAAWNVLEEYTPMTSALDAPPEALPAYRLAQLDAAVQKQFGRGRTSSLLGSSWTNAIWNWVALPQRAGTLLTLAMVLFGMFLYFRPAIKPRNGPSGAEVMAYLVSEPGQAQVFRGGGPIPTGAVTRLWAGDQVQVAEGAVVEVLASTGATHLRGPMRWTATPAAPTKAQSPNELALKPGSVQQALFRPVNELLAAGLLTTSRGTQGIDLYSPREATRQLKPVILWKSEPGKSYDVTITDEFGSHTEPWQVRGVVSPLEFGSVEAWKHRPLAPDGLYRIRIRESTRPLIACEYTFRTLSGTTANSNPTPVDKIGQAYASLTEGSPCPGDALADLLNLPPELGNSELVLRLKLLLFGQLGLHDDYDSTSAKLKGLAMFRDRQE
jgi:hypothetical protein